MQTESTPTIAFDKAGLDEHYLTLTECQQKFVDLVVQWCQNPRKTLVVLSGGPGTGKSYVVVKTLQHVQTEQLKMSYTNRSARAIGGQTIHAALNLNCMARCKHLEAELENETDLVKCLDASRGLRQDFRCDRHPNIVFVDEVSMVSCWLMYWVIRYFMDRTTQPVLFIACGDRHQLAPVKCKYNLFSFSFHEKSLWDMHMIQLKTNVRFDPEYAKLIDRLREFVDAENEEGLFSFILQRFPVVDELNFSYVHSANRAMASTNDWVKTFNTYYLKNMMQGPEIWLDDILVLKPGCIVFATETVGPVANGTELVFQEKKGEDAVLCTLAEGGKEVEIERSSFKRFPLTLGFAATVHRFQGDTLSRETKVVIHFNKNRNLNMAYTALSRVKSLDQIVAISL